MKCPKCGHEFEGMRVITEEDYKELKDAWAAMLEGE